MRISLKMNEMITWKNIIYFKTSFHSFFLGGGWILWFGMPMNQLFRWNLNHRGSLALGLHNKSWKTICLLFPSPEEMTRSETLFPNSEGHLVMSALLAQEGVRLAIAIISKYHEPLIWVKDAEKPGSTTQSNSVCNLDYTVYNVSNCVFVITLYKCFNSQ